jgi:hypothetical protein
LFNPFFISNLSFFSHNEANILKIPPHDKRPSSKKETSFTVNTTFSFYLFRLSQFFSCFSHHKKAGIFPAFFFIAA